MYDVNSILKYSHSHFLAAEIALILVIKLAAIFMIWWYFFSAPVDLKQPHQGVEQHFGLAPLSTEQNAETTTLSTSTTEAQDG